MTFPSFHSFTFYPSPTTGGRPLLPPLLSSQTNMAAVPEETDCVFCKYPNTASVAGAAVPTCSLDASKRMKMTRRDRTRHMDNCVVCSAPCYRTDTSFDIADLGRVPVLKGDLQIIPDKVKDFIVEQISVMRPSSIYICNGSPFEDDHIKEILCREGRLSQVRSLPNVYTAQADPTDTETLDDRIFTSECNGNSIGAFSSVTRRARDELIASFVNIMRGRTMFVIPFSVGPIGARTSLTGVQLTDCPFTLLTSRIFMRVSSAVWDAIGTGDFIQCVHSVGVPRPVLDMQTYMWPCNRANSFTLVNSRRRRVYSFGTAHFANSLCRTTISLRVATECLREREMFAESAAIISIINPSGEEIFACVQGPLGTGKSTIAFAQSSLPGWTIRPLSSTTAWLRWGNDGRLYASSPENGFCVQWSYREHMAEKQPVEDKALRKRSLLLNVTAGADGDLEWFGRNDQKIKATGRPAGKSCAAIFATDVETLHPHWDSPEGVPISAYIFLVNRPTIVPVISESPSWKEGIALTLTTRTMKGTGLDGEILERNPMGMSTYLSCPMGEYVRQWFGMEKEGRKMPRIFHMNLFRRHHNTLSPVQTPAAKSVSVRSYSKDWSRPLTPDATSPRPEQRLAPTCWPGFGDNVRLLAWVHERVNGKGEDNTEKTVLGIQPKTVNTEGEKGEVDWDACMKFDAIGWRTEVRSAKKYIEREAKLAEVDTVYMKEYLKKAREALIPLTQQVTCSAELDVKEEQKKKEEEKSLDSQHKE